MAAKSETQIGVAAETGDRVVGAAGKDNAGKYALPLLDADGHTQVDVLSGGGGTQYTEGDTDTTITGTVALAEGPSDTATPLQVDASKHLQVDIAASSVTITVDGSGVTQPVSHAALTELAAAIDTEVQCDIVSGTITTVSTLTGGGVAHDSADSGNPVKVGAKAFSPDGTTPGTAVAENDRSDLKTDLNGRLLVNTVSPQRGHKHLDGTAAYTDESLVADPGDGFQIVITHISFSSGEAVAINFFLEEGSTKIFGPIYIEAVAGRGYVSGPIHLPVTASTAVTLTTSAANDQSFDMDYFIQAV